MRQGRLGKKANDGSLRKSARQKKGSSQRSPGTTKLEVRIAAWEAEHGSLLDAKTKSMKDTGQAHQRPGSQNRNK